MLEDRKSIFLQSFENRSMENVSMAETNFE